MITYFQAAVLGALQGITELFPVSSLGHSVLLPSLLGWNIGQKAPYYLVFLVATHLATSLVLFVFFFNDWVLIIKGIARSLKKRVISNDDHYAKLGWLLVVATIPAGVLGLLFEEKLKTLFALPYFAALFLILNGCILFSAEFLRKKIKMASGSVDTAIANLSWSKAVKVGFAQTLALIPGLSRTGTTLVGGLLVGLDHESAARFSFLLATPIIFAAAVLKLPELLSASRGYPLGPIIIGVLASAVCAYFSVAYLTKYFKTKTLKPFAIYCICIGILSLLFISHS